MAPSKVDLLVTKPVEKRPQERYPVVVHSQDARVYLLDGSLVIRIGGMRCYWCRKEFAHGELIATLVIDCSGGTLNIRMHRDCGKILVREYIAEERKEE